MLRQNMHRVLFLLCVVAIGAHAAQTAPGWLDTIPPVVSAQPAERFHRSVFHVVLTANENARIKFGIDSPHALQTYSRPVSITREGPTVIYFTAEDDFENRSKLDSLTYVLDTRPPVVTVEPRPGRYRRPVTVEFSASEPAKFYMLSSPDAPLGQELTEPFMVTNSFSAYIAAVDRAGNQGVSDKVDYIVDTTTVQVGVVPDGGLFNRRITVSFRSDPPADIFYSFDALRPVSDFSLFSNPVKLPYGLTLVRFYARTKTGAESELLTSKFVVDTLPPRLRMQARSGPVFDTLILSTKEPSVIRYSVGARLPGEDSPIYRAPLIIPKKGMAQIAADARDSAGNISQTLRWERKYDKTPPEIRLSSRGGVFNEPVDLRVDANEEVSIYYTVDGTEPTLSSLPYTGPVAISKEGTTIFRCIAVDAAGNVSKERGAKFTIDSKAPQVRVRIESDIQENAYHVILSANESSRIYYETGGRTPTNSSPEYQTPLLMKTGQTLKYFAVDMAGNATPVKVMEELDRPMVAATPAGGTYNRRINIAFKTNMDSKIFWRIEPDTSFHVYRDTIRFDEEGVYTIEYFSRNEEGVESPRRRETYQMDWTPPRVDVTVRKGINDSIAVFLECSENASVYYTLDGSSPLFSTKTKVAGNKFAKSRDRLSVVRKEVGKFAFYAEDAVGNQSALTVMDLAKPRAVPSVVSGSDRVYRKALSIAFSTVDEKSQIYFAQHGNSPTTDSSLYREPITLLHSDTLLAFVVDAAGFKGEVDTFVYKIDYPPSPRFVTLPDRPHVGDVVRLDASGTSDQETPLRSLLFRWDFDGDGEFETSFQSDAGTTHIFERSGIYEVVLEVKDELGRVSSFSRRVNVSRFCPEGMVFHTDTSGKGFCIDTYEWPNEARKTPRVNVSWVEAKMVCEKQGKRLCSASEWIAACRGWSKTNYPYGSRYDPGRCATEGTEVSRSGAYSKCQSGSGTMDMVGNAWEWVEDKSGDYPKVFGGSFRSGESARCEDSFQATVGEINDDVGFRCCK